MSDSELIGFDAIMALSRESGFRSVIESGDLYYSVADFLKKFAPEDRVFTDWWKREKKKILAIDSELVRKMHQLKMTAPDGKARLTDAAPLETCIFILLNMDTPHAIAFKERIAKALTMSVEEIAYRAANVLNGSEWAADSNHQQMLNAGAIRDDLFKDDTGVYRG